MPIYLRVSMEWLENGIGWNFKNCGFFIYIGSITCWTCNNDFVSTT
jgi:hypothetical protein